MSDEPKTDQNKEQGVDLPEAPIQWPVIAVEESHPVVASPARPAQMANTKDRGTCEPDPCKQPDPLLVDDVQECGGDVSVLAFAYPDSKGTGPFKEGYKTLANVEVTLSGQHARRTDERGRTSFRDVPAGDHTLTASARRQYGAPQLFQVNGDESPGFNGKITVKSGDEHKLQVGYSPQPATISGYVYYDAHRSGDPAGQARIGGATLDFLMEGKRFDCTTTDANGNFDEEIDRPGLIAISPRAHIRTKNGHDLQRADTGPLLLQAEAGQSYEISLRYVARLGSFQIVARLEKEAGCKKEERITLPGVTFQIYRGPSASAKCTAR